jgi:hypothetical protein
LRDSRFGFTIQKQRHHAGATTMLSKQPVIILEGGMAALAAAYELSCTDD